ncbi:MAG: hypothetical protein P8J32_01395 [bacterium]|jgi:hypothetical protein|nr:hypothetical protein [bacterium]
MDGSGVCVACGAGDAELNEEKKCPGCTGGAAEAPAAAPEAAPAEEAAPEAAPAADMPAEEAAPEAPAAE